MVELMMVFKSKIKFGQNFLHTSPILTLSEILTKGFAVSQL